MPEFICEDSSYQLVSIIEHIWSIGLLTKLAKIKSLSPGRLIIQINGFEFITLTNFKYESQTVTVDYM